MNNPGSVRFSFFKVFIFMFGTFLVTGCADTLQTTSHPMIVSNVDVLEEKATGVSYFLPQRRMLLTATGVRPPKKAKANLLKSLATVKLKEPVVKEAKKTSKRLKAVLTALISGGNAGAISEAKKKLAEADGKLIEVRKALAIANTDLSQKSALYVLFADDDKTLCKFKVSFSLKLLSPEPDVSHHYVANLQHLPWRDDALDITVGANGLLSSANATSTDRTADILIEFAKIVGSVGTPGQEIALFREKEKDSGCPDPFTFQQAFDPLSGDTDWINEKLEELLKGGQKFRIQVHQSGIPKSSKSPAASKIKLMASRIKKNVRKNKFNLASTSSVDGLLYRRAIPYVVSIEQAGKDSEDFHPIQAAVVMLPNKGPVSVVPFEAGPFVTTVTKVEFKDGMLTKWDVNKPSELLSIVRLPIALLKAVISAPAEIIKLRVDLTNENTALIDAQKAQIEALKAMQELQKQVNEAREASETSGANPQ